jgi:hypothetical protein
LGAFLGSYSYRLTLTNFAKAWINDVATTKTAMITKAFMLNLGKQQLTLNIKDLEMIKLPSVLAINHLAEATILKNLRILS